jgi:hypothetical protein
MQVTDQLKERRRDGLLIVSDGGGDHNVSFETVKLSLLAVALVLRLPFLAAMRTCAGQSYTNPAERVMPILNLAMYGVSLARTRDDDAAMEKKLSNLTSMSQVREAAAGDPALRTAYETSVAPVLEGLCTRFNMLKLKGEPFVASTTPMAEMETFLMNALDELFPLPGNAKHVARMQLTVKARAKMPQTLVDFLATHCVQSSHMFEFRTCGDAPAGQLHWQHQHALRQPGRVVRGHGRG